MALRPIDLVRRVLLYPRRTLALLCLLAAFPLATLAARDVREQAIGHHIDAELDYLLGFVGPSRADPAGFRIERIGETLSFVNAQKPRGALYYAEARRGAAAAYFETDLGRSLKDVVRLGFDSDIPASVMAPSTVRTAQWKRITSGDLSQLWTSLPDLTAPQIVIGTEHLVNTPDTHTGAYYSYDLDRTLLLLASKDQQILISLSTQSGPSAVGQRGLIVGPDDQWTYLYTDRPGLNWPGLGWVQSYMYDSQSVAFYIASDRASSRVRFAVFKWIRAGWVGMNLVRSRHIYDGLQRFGSTFKRILQSRATADVDAVARRFAAIQRMPPNVLRPLAERFVQSLRTRLAARSSSKDGEAAEVLSKPNQLAEWTPQSMAALVSVERLKAILGMPHELDPKLIDAASSHRD